MKAINRVLQLDKERYKVPRRVQDTIPIKRIWTDGIFLAGTRYAKSFKFTDVNYLVASKEAQESMFLNYAAFINSLDYSATTKLTVNNHFLNRRNFEENVLMPLCGDALDHYRREYNGSLRSTAMAGHGIIQEKYVTVSVCKRNITEIIGESYLSAVSIL